ILLTSGGAAEREALRRATEVLGRWIRDDEPVEQVLRTVAAILNAADGISLAAAGGGGGAGASCGGSCACAGPCEQVLRTVAAILNAADVISLAAAGGRAEPRVRPPT